ncbi:hypothetical protein ABMY20_15330 [Tenacibaculum sp. SSH1-16]|uniref:hypothetical protein n=1 Tax=Tenacibaculum sp. SSH1-16 TaxID=3136667 RepID=UPI0032C477E9|nr:hypothetical protein BACY1_20860 [Tenacibaculum mesophilum]
MNTELCNTPEDFIREIRHVIVYNASVLTFNQNLKGLYPPTIEYLYKIPVQTPESFKRRFRLKKQNKNNYFTIDLSFPFFDLTFQNRAKLYDLAKDNNYVVVVASNREMMVLGNDRERLSIDVIDNIQDNSRGKDHFSIQITGETIIHPLLRKVSEPFRVLFFANRLQ